MSMKNEMTEKIVAYFERITAGLESGELVLEQLPIQDMLSLVRTGLTSNAQNVTIASTERLINRTFSLLLDAIEFKNSYLFISVLQIVIDQLNCFSELDGTWKEEYELTLACLEKTQYATSQFTNYQKPLHSDSTYFVGKGAIYTAITSGYDVLCDPVIVTPNIDYICFTDDTNITSDIWQIRKLNNPLNLDSIRLARHCKLFPHLYLSEYDYSIWIDAKFLIKRDLTELIPMFHQSSSLLCFPHYERDCIYEEAARCLDVELGIPEEIHAQIERYRMEKYPEHNGLIDSGILFRDHHDMELMALMDTWWREIKSGSYRDQISFNYACWKNNFHYDLCNMFIYVNPYIYLNGHHNENLQ